MKKCTVYIRILLGLMIFKTVNSCQDVKNKVITYDNCETELMTKPEYLHIKCNHVFFDVYEMPTTFRGSLSNVSDSSKYANGCLKLVETELKLNYVKLYAMSAPHLKLPAPRVNSRLECHYLYHVDYSMGFVKYDKSCIQESILLSEKHNNLSQQNVSHCVEFVKAVDVSVSDEELEQINNTVFKFYSYRLITKFNSSIVNYALRSSGFTLKSLNLPDLAALRIRGLDVSGNTIEKIVNDDFPLMPTLRNLNFENCEIKEIESKAFELIPNLETLNLAGNFLRQLPDAFASLKHLQTLNLRRNYKMYFNVSENNRPTLSQLSSLDLSDMTIEFDALDMKMSSLTHLNLSNARFFYDDHMKRETFPFDIPDIQNLSLSSYPSFVHKVDQLPRWTELRALDLSQNQIQNMSKYISLFSHFINLRELNLAENNIREVSIFPILTNHNTRLYLNLSRNSIEFWNITKFDKTAHELSVNLSANKITIVSSAMLSDFKALKNVNLDDNPFDCTTCAVEPFYQWLLGSSNPKLYTCFYPEDLRNTVITDLNIDPDSCTVNVFKQLLKILLPIIILIFLSIIIVVTSLKYKWHLHYLFHLIRARINSRRNNPLLNLTTQFKYDAFVSYCTSDCDWVVKELIVHLEQEEPELHLCVHERDFAIGGTIIDNVIDCIDQSRKSIFLLSNMFIRSNWCQWELQMAQHKLFEDGSDVLVLILLEDLEAHLIPRTLQRLMATRTYLVWPQKGNAQEMKLFWSRLRQFIGKCHCLHEQIKCTEEELL